MHARYLALWLAASVYLALVIGFAWTTSTFAQGLAAIGIASAIVHASLSYGTKHALALFSICVVVAFFMENLGVATGFPFGHYHFEVGKNLPQVGAIPLVVGPLWFGMGYFSWSVAAILMGGADHRLGTRFNTFALPVTAALVMTQWDLVLDPPSSTISKAWVWHDGGAFFGVPASNFAGWFLTSWIFFQLFVLYFKYRLVLQPAPRSKNFRAISIGFYLSAGLTHLTPWLLGQTGEAADGSGRVWHVEDVRETAVIVMVLTMGVTSFLALVRLYGENGER